MVNSTIYDSGLESVISSSKGDILKLDSQYGTHIVKVTDLTKKSKKTQLAMLVKEAVASKTTYSDFYAQANELVSKAEGDYAKFNAAAKEQKPNILWVIIEDLSTDLSCYGTKGVETPNIDKLASEGVLYTNAYTTAPVSSASRTAMMSGYYQNFVNGEQHRTHQKQPLPYGIKPIPHLMKEAGYYTHLMCWKTDNNFLPFKKDQLFEDVRDWKTYKKGVPFFKKDVESGRPFFARMTFGGTHRAWNRDVVRPIDPKDVEIPPYYVDNEFVRRDWANGLEQMQICDREVGELLQCLEDEGLSDNTLVIFLADNGRCHIRGKQFLYEPGSKVPMIVRWPGKIKPGSVNNDLVVALDICATVVDIAGAKPALPLHGVNLFNGETAKREYLFTTRDKMDETHDAMRAVRDKKGYKLIHNLMPERPYLQYNQYKEGGYPVLAEMNYLYLTGQLNEVQSQFFASTKPEFELFDLNKDPYEVKNLANDPKYKKIKARLLKELNSWRKTVLEDDGVSKEFSADDIFPATLPKGYESVDDFVFKNHQNYDFNKYGWPSWFPTRSAEEWKKIRDAWVPYLFREAGTSHDRPVIVKDYIAKQKAKAKAKAAAEKAAKKRKK